jgi:hypothetical protein
MMDRAYSVALGKLYCSSVDAWPDVMLLLALVAL